MSSSINLKESQAKRIRKFDLTKVLTAVANVLQEEEKEPNRVSILNLKYVDKEKTKIEFKLLLTRRGVRNYKSCSLNLVRGEAKIKDLLEVQKIS